MYRISLYLNGELTLRFAAPHRMTTGDIVTVSIPGQTQLNGVETSVSVLADDLLRVGYSDAKYISNLEGYYGNGFSPPARGKIQQNS